MSTILHPVHHHTRVYAAAAAALAVGLLVVLMTMVLGPSETSTEPRVVPDGEHAATHAYRVPCYAARPSVSIEQKRPGCRH